MCIAGAKDENEKVEREKELIMFIKKKAYEAEAQGMLAKAEEEEKENTCTTCKHPSQTNHKFCEMCGRKLTLANEEEKDSNILDVSKTYSYIISE